MSPSMRQLLTDEVEDLPTSPIPVDAVISDGRRRLWRRRIVGGAGAGAAVVALAALAVQVVPFGGDGGVASPAGFEQRKVTYAAGSSIHYGDQTIDISPHQVWSFVQTDDGFVFTTESGDVYLADGGALEQIGDGNDDGVLAADDTGSYVAWVDGSEAVVYDTADRAEVARTEVDGDPADGVWHDDGAPTVSAVDGDTAYWRTGEGVVAWDLSTQSGEVVVAHEDQFFVHDVAGGQIAQLWTAGAKMPRHVVVSENADADRPRFPKAEDGDLSPTAAYLAIGDQFDNPDSRVFDVATGKDVTPTAEGYRTVQLRQWINDNRYVASARPAGGGQVDLLTCSVAEGTCEPAASSVGAAGELRFPVGEPGR